MKKFLVVLLSLGLIAAFTATASAADVKFAGNYYVAGMYENNPELTTSGSSRAVFQQRIRITPIFQIADGLTFTTRFDAMEKAWGNTAWASDGKTTTDNPSKRQSSGAAAGTYVQENIEFEQGFITAKTGIGTFQVGYQNGGAAWGTDFGTSGSTRPGIKWFQAFGPATLGFFYEKYYEYDTVPGNKVDADSDVYSAYGIYKFTGGEAGLLYQYYVNAINKTNTAAPYKTVYSQVAPYVKATFGAFYVEGEVNYLFGKARKYDDGGTTVPKPSDRDEESLTAYIKAQMNMGPAVFGAQFAYMSGNDPDDTTKVKETVGGNVAWDPTLIMAAGARADFGGKANGPSAGGVTLDDGKKNYTLYQIFGSYEATPKILIESALSYGIVNEKPGVGAAKYISDKIGTEFDLKATYKIFDNLSYMVAGGYLWTGDYFKGSNTAAVVENNYVVINKLELKF